jgi:hypothetical protein
MREVALLLLEDLQSRVPLLFDEYPIDRKETDPK